MSETLREQIDSSPTAYLTLEEAQKKATEQIVDMNPSQFQKEQDKQFEIDMEKLTESLGNKAVMLVDKYPVNIISNAA